MESPPSRRRERSWRGSWNIPVPLKEDTRSYVGLNRQTSVRSLATCVEQDLVAGTSPRKSHTAAAAAAGRPPPAAAQSTSSPAAVAIIKPWIQIIIKPTHSPTKALASMEQCSKPPTLLPHQFTPRLISPSPAAASNTRDRDSQRFLLRRRCLRLRPTLEIHR